MTQQSAPPVITICPACHNAIGCVTTRDVWGILHPLLPLEPHQLERHVLCDQDRIAAALSRSAYHLSHVTTYKIVKGDT